MNTASETVVRGVIGQPVTLPCSYQVAQEKDISDMCWGRGPCPHSKCNGKLLHTTGSEVTFRTSQRYNLQGYISYGDVSLTIQEVKAEDAGTYCCRVEIPGWFNDIKKNIQLVVLEGEFWDFIHLRETQHCRRGKNPIVPVWLFGFDGRCFYQCK